MKQFFLLLIGLSFIHAGAEARSLSGEAQVSLLTSSPYEGEVFTLYGHAAIRLKDGPRRMDWVFNYGVFSFDKPNFIYRFAKGETDYMLGVMKYGDYMAEYRSRGSTVTEQVLNLSPAEKERIWEALSENYEPENREYRYNFFFDNCATRPARLIEDNIAGRVDYCWDPAPETFREAINRCTRNHSWLTFGCDLALGSPTDRTMMPREMLFLPEYLKEAVAGAVIVSGDGTTRPLVCETKVSESEPGEAPAEWCTPLLCAVVVWLAVGILTVWESKRRIHLWGLDCLLFLAAGLSGCVLFFLGFVSEHPCTSPNWTMLWLHPLQLLVVPFSLVKKARMAGYCYHFINFAAVMLMLASWHFLPQHFNAAFVPLMLALWIRSASVILAGRSRREKGKAEEQGKWRFCPRHGL